MDWSISEASPDLTPSPTHITLRTVDDNEEGDNDDNVYYGPTNIDTRYESANRKAGESVNTICVSFTRYYISNCYVVITIHAGWVILLYHNVTITRFFDLRKVHDIDFQDTHSESNIKLHPHQLIVSISSPIANGIDSKDYQYFLHQFIVSISIPIANGIDSKDYQYFLHPEDIYTT